MIKEDKEIAKGSFKRKDTKRWCKGKVGKEHTHKIMPYDDAKRRGTSLGFNKSITRNWFILCCSECGKELDIYMPFGKLKHKKPEWLKKYLESIADNGMERLSNM